eukprot:jgi/Orpsp1_1/1174910/evm.model.c7180000051924.1
MKFYNNKWVNLLYFVSNIIIQSRAKSIINEEQLNKFKYGEEEFTLAVIGDSGSDPSAKEVMKLSSFDALLHLGDYDYKCLPDKYFNNILDSDRKYQFMGVIGNHDAKHQCPDDVAEKFLNNRIIGLSSFINGADKRSDQLKFLKKHLSEAKEDWKICSWHFYDKYYHTGKYQKYGNIVSGDGDHDESFYDYCKDHGAIIFSAHDHVYARTNVMSKFKDQSLIHMIKTESNIVQIRKGATFNILNGAGGWEIYIEQGEQKYYSHWVKKYAKGEHNENAKRFGGLFCKFNYGGNNKKAYCEFLRINSSEKVFDSFYIYRNDNPEEISYSKIDDDFLNNKILAYKIENNIIDEDSNNNSNSNDNSVLKNDNDKANNNEGWMGKSSSIKNIFITGGIFCAVVLICGTIIIFKKTKKVMNEEERK